MSELITLAGGVLLNDANQMLLLHRNTEKLTQWEMPAGECEGGESPEEAMRRGLRKETGVYVETARFLALAAIWHDGKQCEFHWFEVTTSDNPRIMEPGVHDELRYYDLFRLRRMESALSRDLLAFSNQLNDGEIRLES